MTHAPISVDKNIRRLQILHDRHSQNEFCAEVLKLLKNADITNTEQWSAVCKMGNDLVPNQQLFSVNLTKALAAFSGARSGPVAPKPDMIKKTHTKLLQINRMARDPIGRKLLLVKIYIELDDLSKIKPLLSAILASDNEQYKTQVRSLLRSLMTNKKHAAELNRESNNTDIKLSDTLETLDTFDTLLRISQDKDLLMAKIYLDLDELDKAKINAQRSTNRSKKVGVYIDQMIAEAISESQQTHTMNNAASPPHGENDKNRMLDAEQVRQLKHNLQNGKNR